jgi:hypothetical protein
MHDVTNPVSLPPCDCVGCSFPAWLYVVLLHFSHDQSNWSPSFSKSHSNNFNVFIFYSPKCLSFSTRKLRSKLNILLVYKRKYLQYTVYCLGIILMLSYYTCSDIVRYVLTSPATKCLSITAVCVTAPPTLFSSIWRRAHIMRLVIMKLSRAFCYFLPARVRKFPQPLLLKTSHLHVLS